MRSILEKSIIRKLLNGSFWFEEDYNKAEKKIVTNVIKKIEHVSNTEKVATEKSVESIVKEIEKNITPQNNFKSKTLEDELLEIKYQLEELKKYRKDSEEEKQNRIKEEQKEKEEKQNAVNKIYEKPKGYIDLYLDSITAAELFLKHKITMQYLNINGRLYIKDIIFQNCGRDFDCYSDGENKSLTITKVSSSQLLIILEEVGGDFEKIIVINGNIV